MIIIEFTCNDCNLSETFESDSRLSAEQRGYVSGWERVDGDILCPQCADKAFDDTGYVWDPRDFM
jgi:rubredoxin